MQANHDASYGGGHILDQDTIDGLIELGGGDDAALLLELVDLFIDDADERMRKIAAAGEEGDLDTIEKMAHALKSASANIGALNFSLSCRELEATAQGSDPAGLGELVSSIQGMYGELGTALGDLKSRHGA